MGGRGAQVGACLACRCLCLCYIVMFQFSFLISAEIKYLFVVVYVALCDMTDFSLLFSLLFPFGLIRGNDCFHIATIWYPI